MARDSCGQAGFECEELLLQGGIADGKDLHREQAGVARAANGDGGHGYAAGHLDNGEERVESLQGLAFNGHADDGQGE